MFDFLKKKIGGFIDNLTKKEEQKEEVKEEAAARESIPENPEIKFERVHEEHEEHEEEKEKEIAEPKKQVSEKPIPIPKDKIEIPEPVPAQPKKTEHAEKPARSGAEAIPKQKPGPAIEKKEKMTVEKQIIPAPKKEPEKKEPATKPKPREPVEAILPKLPTPSEPHVQKPEPKEPPRKEEPRIILVQENTIEKAKEKQTEKPIEKPKEKERVKLGVFSAIKGIVTGEVEISEKEVSSLLDDLELELLEADVEMSVAGAIRDDLKERLSGAKVKRGSVHEHVGSVIRETLTSILMSDKDFDLVSRVKDPGSEKPIKIVFLGINGAGKTTTMAKVARMLMDNGCKVSFAAADTFRAAAIEQLSAHAERLNVKVIKRDYGADPTSVAYDAVSYSKAHGLDAVLIDTAGRQDTNISLINEMKKMDRVIKPDIKIYVGESIAGNAIIEQISSFNREIEIDGVILTKLDCDPKGGTMLSISKATGIPIIYIGTGQAYSDLERFDAAEIAARIVS